jgi:hypothetical protein
MKTITIRLPDVEAAMLQQLMRRFSGYRALQESFLKKIARDFTANKDFF